jgi:GTP-binding protein EngB required for normal cell division
MDRTITDTNMRLKRKYIEIMDKLDQCEQSCKNMKINHPSEQATKHIVVQQQVQQFKEVTQQQLISQLKQGIESLLFY